MKKVFCMDCKHYGMIGDDCYHPTNITSGKNYKWPGMSWPVLNPQGKNSSNNCSDFQKTRNIFKLLFSFISTL